MKKERPKVGVFSITSCAGCQLSLLFMEDTILQVMEKVDIINFPLLKEENEEGPFDIAFIEGAVVREEEIEYIRKIREKSDIVIALGTCATYGGVPSIRDFGYEKDITEEVYPEPSYLHSVEVSGIGKYIKVDYFLRGCPINKEETVQLLKNILAGKKIPLHTNYPVCVECRARENPCLLQAGKFCLGPVTYGGCKALCPSGGRSCYGCRGPLDDANVDALVSLFRKRGLTNEELKRIFVKFAGTSKKFIESGVTRI